MVKVVGNFNITTRGPYDYQRICGSAALHQNCPLGNFTYSRNVIGNKRQSIYYSKENPAFCRIKWRKLKLDLPILKDKDIFPDSNVLRKALNDDFKIFQEFETTITNGEHKLVGEWRYYNDGKAWIYKAQYKKKTVFWLSVISTGFTVTFYFNGKNYEGVFDLSIEESIKDDFKKMELVGKLHPLQISVNNTNQIPDILDIIEYKKKS